MEAVMLNSTGDNKNRFGNPTWTYGSNRSLFPYPSDNLLLTSFLNGGHFTGAGGGFMSMPPVVSGFRPPQNLHHYRQQPPLLPLPISPPVNYRNTNIARSYSSPYNNINNINNNNNRLSLKKSKKKNQKKDSKKEVKDLVPPATAEEKQPPPAAENSSESEIVISRVSDDVDEFSGSSVFTPSPPPSSLPFPTFFLRSKASCKAQASGVDAGATDGLRRLLRI